MPCVVSVAQMVLILPAASRSGRVELQALEPAHPSAFLALDASTASASEALVAKRANCSAVIPVSSCDVALDC